METLHNAEQKLSTAGPIELTPAVSNSLKEALSEMHKQMRDQCPADESSLKNQGFPTVIVIIETPNTPAVIGQPPITDKSPLIGPISDKPVINSPTGPIEVHFPYNPDRTGIPLLTGCSAESPKSGDRGTHTEAPGPQSSTGTDHVPCAGDTTADGGKISRSPDGTVTTTWKDGTVRIENPDGTGQVTRADGSFDHWGPHYYQNYGGNPQKGTFYNFNRDGLREETIAITEPLITHRPFHEPILRPMRPLWGELQSTGNPELDAILNGKHPRWASERAAEDWLDNPLFR
jgi:hypothetical protein